VTKKKKEPEGLKGAKKKAEDFAYDKEKTVHLIEEAIEKANKNKGALKEIWENLLALFRLVKAWAMGQYKDVPWQTVILAITAIIYFVNPFDLIPDFLPGGYVDDATVVGFVINSIINDLDAFKNWEKCNS